MRYSPPSEGTKALYLFFILLLSIIRLYLNALLPSLGGVGGGLLFARCP